MGFAFNPGCGCCGCAVVPRPYMGSYAKVTIAGVAAGTCADCATIFNKTHLLACLSGIDNTSSQWQKSLSTTSPTGAQADCSTTPCASSSSSDVNANTSLSGSDRVVSSVSVVYRDAGLFKRIINTCSGGTWTPVLDGTSTGCDFSAATITFDGFVLDSPYFCSSALDWSIYAPSYTLASTTLRVTVSGCTVAPALNTTHNLAYSSHLGTGLLFTNGNLWASLRYKQAYPIYQCEPTFNETTSVVCMISNSFGGGTVQFKWNSSSLAWVTTTGDGSITAAQFV